MNLNGGLAVFVQMFGFSLDLNGHNLNGRLAILCSRVWISFAAHKDRLYLLARDVGNPSHRDPDFPVVRHQDFYNGFSWATGIVPGERQEESASEVRTSAALGQLHLRLLLIMHSFAKM